MKLVFRCDATAATGFGHLSRSLAFAEAWRRRGHQAFFFGQWSASGSAMLAHADFPFQSAETTTGSDVDADFLGDLMARERAEGVLADSYALGVSWLRRLASAGCRVILIDDFGLLPDYSSIAGVINFTVEAHRLRYEGLPASQRALGPDFFPARESLRQLRNARPVAKANPPDRILISMGGGDHLGKTLPIYRAIRHAAPGIQLRALMPEGPARAAAEGLAVSDFPPPVPDLAEHLRWADACVTGGGLLKYECAYVGIPMAIYSQTPEQQAETERFCASGLGWDLTPAGNTADWAKRLSAFLQRPQPEIPPGLKIPVDSCDRAARAMEGFLSGCPATLSQLLSA